MKKECEMTATGKAIEALQAAQNGLAWYRDAYPKADSQADDEMNQQIEEAVAALQEQSGVEPLIDHRCKPSFLGQLKPITLTGYNLKMALEFLAPDDNEEQLEQEVCIQWKDEGKDSDGDHSPAGWHCWLEEYPEEGSIPIDPDNAPGIGPRKPVDAAAQEETPAFEWPKLDKPARVGGGIFGAGVSSRHVVEAAQRHHLRELEQQALTPEQRADQEQRVSNLRALIRANQAENAAFLTGEEIEEAESARGIKAREEKPS